MPRFSLTAARQLAANLACAAGVPFRDADLLAESLVDADLGGTGTHGLSRLGIYLKRIEAGVIDPRAELRVERQRAAMLAVDAANGLGQVQASRTLELLEPMARNAGVAVATVRRSGHCGALWWYGNRMAARDFILLAMTNAEPTVAPEGGSQAFFGTNPIAASFPTGRGFPLKVDLATSAIARGNIIAAQRTKRPIPADWALDPDGEPTTDPDRAFYGALLPMAGHKGYALAWIVEAFGGVLAGAAIGAGIGSMYKDPDRPQDVGHFFCLLDIAAFMDVGEFKARMDRTITEIKARRRRPGVEEILVPGERSHRLAEANRRDGVPLGEDTVQELRGLCEKLGVAFTLT